MALSQFPVSMILYMCCHFVCYIFLFKRMKQFRNMMKPEVNEIWKALYCQIKSGQVVELKKIINNLTDHISNLSGYAPPFFQILANN